MRRMLEHELGDRLVRCVAPDALIGKPGPMTTCGIESIATVDDDLAPHAIGDLVEVELQGTPATR